MHTLRDILVKTAGKRGYNPRASCQCASRDGVLV